MSRRESAGIGREVRTRRTEGPADDGEMVMKCPKCGAEYPEGQKFCGNCGGSLDDPPEARLGLVKCPNCGFDNPEGKRFCADCGSMIPRTPRIASPAQDRKKKVG